MTTELPKTYEPAAAQTRWVEHWLSQGYCDADPTPGKEQHTIMIPLPNVTGALHMGHCLNGTVQDLLTRWRRMQGRVALWMPGTDHAGIATQAVVERRMLEEEGLTRHDIGRDALVERIWTWKNDYEARILNQLKQIGASCDWRRVRFTLDDVCSKAVRRTFFKMFCDGLIYRGKRLVNWDTYLQTAVADDEVFSEDIAGHFWTMNYPVMERRAGGVSPSVQPGGDASGESTGGLTPSARLDEDWIPIGQKISFSTTRPETMLGDTAICVHPTDERYTDLIGKHVMIPVNGRIIPIIADALLVDKTLGTGAVKVTPAHDPNDYACGLRNNLPMINILNADGTLNEEGGEYAGLDRFEARKKIVAKMESLGHLEKVEDRIIPMKYSDRSKTPIEPFLSDQWFVKMDTLAESAIDAVKDGRVRFFPQRYANSYLDWLGEKRDWCISRQLWWGHQIPVWTFDFPLPTGIDPTSPQLKSLIIESLGITKILEEKSGFTFNDVIDFQIGASLKDGHVQALFCVADGHLEFEKGLEAAGAVRDPDVLDTWFSSAIWPHATLGWPDLEHNPPMLRRAPGVSPGVHKASANIGGDPEMVRRVDAPRSPSGKNEVLDFFYPGSVLVTSRDIITLWVARMVLAGLYNMGEVPFKHVYIHPKILDGLGQTMSKSKGNGVDPLDLIDKYGTDAVRFTISSLCGETQDVRLPVGYECPHCQAVIPQTKEHQEMRPMGGATPSIKCAKCKKSFQFPSPWFKPDEGAPVARIVSERFEYGRNFCNKLWNACRFAFMNLEGYTPGPVAESELQVEDRWVLSRLATTVREVTTMLERYQFDQATRAVREFTWNEFCDWYLEMLKPRFRDEAAKPVAQRCLVVVVDTLIRLLHPFAPFITEELWHLMAEFAPVRSTIGGGEQELNRADSATGAGLSISERSTYEAAESVMIAPWPDLPLSMIDSALEKRFERLQETIVAVRNVRSVYGIAPGAPLKLFMRCAPDVAEQLKAVAGQFDFLSKTMLEAAGLDVTAPEGSVSFSMPDADGYIPVGDSIDRAAVKKNKEKEAEKLRGFIASADKKLANEGFMAKAPADVVEGIRATKAEQEAQLESIERIVRELS